MRDAALVFSIVTALGACGPEAVSAAAAPCPTQAEAQTALTKYINTSYWSPAQREIWKVKAVDGFTFSALRVGNIVKKQVEFGQLAQDVCPIRVTYAFNVAKQDGSSVKTEMGADKTHLFYKDPFGDWIFRVE